MDFDWDSAGKVAWLVGQSGCEMENWMETQMAGAMAYSKVVAKDENEVGEKDDAMAACLADELDG